MAVVEAEEELFLRLHHPYRYVVHLLCWMSLAIEHFSTYMGLERYLLVYGIRPVIWNW